MKTFLPLIALLAFCAAGSAQELFVTFEDVAAGTTDSAINMGTISKTNGNAVTFSWSGSAGRVSVENWNGSFGLLRPVTVNGTSYDVSAPTKMLQVKADDTTSAQQQFRWNFAASRKASIGFLLVVSNFTGLGSYYNPAGLSGGTPFSVLSLINDNPITLQAETNSNVGASINIQNNVPVWCTGLWDSANSKTIWDFYNLTNGVFLGRSTGAVTANSTVTYFALGIHDAHSKDPGTVYRLNHAILYTNGTVWPVWPGSALQMPTNFTPTGVSAALAASSAGDHIVLPATNVTWTSGVTVSQDSRVIRGLGGTNGTVITADGSMTAFVYTGDFNTISNLQIKGDGTTDEADGIHIDGGFLHMSDLLLVELNVPYYFTAPGLLRRSVIVDGWRSGGRHIFGSAFYDANYPQSLDSTNVACMEDNDYYWTSGKNLTGNQAFLSSQVGQAWVFRHNRFFITNSAVTAAPVFDYHGDSSGLSRPGVIAQIYANKFYFGSALNVSGNKFFDIRGSRAMCYSNLVYGVTYDSDKGVVLRVDSISGTPSWLVNNTYVFENYDGASATHAMAVTPEGGLTEGVDFFTSRPSPLVQLAYPHPLVAQQTGSSIEATSAPGKVSGFQFSGASGGGL